MKKAFMTTIALGIAAIFMIGILAVPMTLGAVLAVEDTEILFDGEKIHGLKGFTYKVYKDRQDVREAGDQILNVDGNIQVQAGSPMQEFMDAYFNDPSIGFVVEVNYFAELQNQDQISEEISFVFEDCVIDSRIVFVDENGNNCVEYQIGVCGQIRVHSNSEMLNKHMDNNTHFQIILSIMQDSYPEGLGIKQFTFDAQHCDDREFQIDSHGYALTSYNFVSARGIGHTIPV